MTIPAGYTSIEDASAKWGRYRNWWYKQVADGSLIGYTFPGIRGTYLKDSEAEAYINTPQPKTKDGAAS